MCLLSMFRALYYLIRGIPLKKTCQTGSKNIHENKRRLKTNTDDLNHCHKLIICPMLKICKLLMRN